MLPTGYYRLELLQCRINRALDSEGVPKGRSILKRHFKKEDNTKACLRIGASCVKEMGNLQIIFSSIATFLWKYGGRFVKNLVFIGRSRVVFRLGFKRRLYTFGKVEAKRCGVAPYGHLCGQFGGKEILEFLMMKAGRLTYFGTRFNFGLHYGLRNIKSFEAPEGPSSHASDYLSPHLKNTDPFLRLHAYWARLELNLGKDLVAARGVWESFLKICGSMLEGWLGYISMEIELGHIKDARSIYKRCYSKRFPGSGSEDICHAWLRFEREFGTLEDLDHAAQKVSPRLEELQLFRSREESKVEEERESISKKNTREKRKQTSDITDEQSPAKRQKDTVRNLNEVHKKDKSQVPNSVEKNKPEETKVQVEETHVTKEEQSKDSNPVKARVYTDHCTAFVSNLHLKANSEDLRKFFSDGGVVGIRILHDKFTGKSRGLAYVDFLDDAHLAAAISKNKQKLLGKKLSIARSEPRRGKRDPSDQSLPREQGRGTDQTDVPGGSVSRESVEASQQFGPPKAPQPNARKPRVEHVQLKGKNTFAVPRNVAALNRTAKKPETKEQDEEKPKSNDEFRKIFTKG
ncbi:RNA binding protein [Trema orientale]|uniref:RNA binding protein n=1 Tax=Trema orientale TaxID=63057 RepID=A0A2P5E9C2_TREOI|nr:RNA binding protein [Trema orientale]